MGQVKILTDSCMYLSPDVVEALDIHIIPMNIHIQDTILKDGQDLTIERFFQEQERYLQDPMNNPSPTVHSPTPEEFADAYTQLYQKTDQILSMHVSYKLSDTISQARNGAEALMGRCTIQMLDTASILLGQGILVQEAAKAAQDGATIDDIIRLVRGLVSHIYTVLYVETMDYLEKSGRIGKAQSILGTMLQIMPMLFIEDGEIIPMEKVKSQERALDKLTEFVTEFDTLEDVIIFQRQAEVTELSETLLNRLNPIFPDQDFPLVQYNPLLASLVGPRGLGVAVYEGAEY